MLQPKMSRRQFIIGPQSLRNFERLARDQQFKVTMVWLRKYNCPVHAITTQMEVEFHSFLTTTLHAPTSSSTLRKEPPLPVAL